HKKTFNESWRFFYLIQLSNRLRGSHAPGIDVLDQYWRNITSDATGLPLTNDVHWTSFFRSGASAQKNLQRKLEVFLLWYFSHRGKLLK
ncbi:hypothetical protein, partial [Gilvibacter sp.]|uniref:hypothetical protein n=1 Tax=Gilvibacter sp. TaxID=2729997 RepID=UPI0035BE870C